MFCFVGLRVIRRFAAGFFYGFPRNELDSQKELFSRFEVCGGQNVAISSFDFVVRFRRFLI
jgi:hypothetical protein